MSGCCGKNCSKCLVFIFNLLFWFSGCALIALGVILMFEQMYEFVFTMLTGDNFPPIFLKYFALGCIGFGGIILFIGFFGCCGALHDSKCMLGTYIFFLILVFVIEASGALIGLYGYFYFPPQVRTDLRMKQYKSYNPISNEENKQFTNTLNYIQYEFHCCGIENNSNWASSKWMNETRAKGQDFRVPVTCCEVKERHHSWEDSAMDDWKTPIVKSLPNCQNSSEYIYKGFSHTKGCYEEMMTWFYWQLKILILTLAKSAFIIILGMSLSVCLIRNISDGEEDQCLN